MSDGYAKTVCGFEILRKFTIIVSDDSSRSPAFIRTGCLHTANQAVAAVPFFSATLNV
jgi:hypothetical protein